MKRLGLATAMMSVVLAGAAPAQLAPGHSGTSSLQTFGSEVAMNELASFGQCYAGSVVRSANRLLATLPGSAEEAQVYRSLFSGESTPCLGSVTYLRVPPQYVRGAIAEGMYRKRVPLAPEVRLAVIQSADVRDLLGAARCLVGQQPAQAQALVATKPASKAELAAMKALMPELSKCLPAGVNANFTSTLIRYRVAEALYRTGSVLPPAPKAG